MDYAAKFEIKKVRYWSSGAFMENKEEKKLSRGAYDVMKDGEDCWLITTNPKNETSAMVYRISDEIVVIEIDDDCATNIVESLMKKYGFSNVKWLLTK